MKKHFTQGKASKLRIFIILILLVSLSLLTLSACNKVDVASISVEEDTIPQNVKVSDFDITKVNIIVKDADGNESRIFATEAMLTTASRESLKAGGEKNITIMFGQKMATFKVNLFEDDAELVTVTFKDKNNSTTIKEITALKGGKITPPEHPVIDGMIADGWTDADNKEVSFLKIDSSITVKARYAQNVAIHTVTFKDFNNVTLGTVEVEHGNRIPGAVSYVAPEGIESWSWTVGDKPLNIDSRIVTGNLIVTMSVVHMKHTVVFQYKDKNNNIEELVTEVVTHKGNAVRASEAITKLTQAGYNFIKWKSSFTNVQTDLNIEAEAAIFSYQVIYKDYQGTIHTTQTINHGDNAAPPDNVPTRTGNIFTGKWKDSSNNIVSLTNIVSNMEVTAVYKAKSINITFWDGASSAIISRDYGTVISAETLGSLKQKEGNILLGIYSDATLQNIFELPYTITTPTLIYSKWIDTINGNSELQYSDADENNTRTVTAYNANDAIVYIPDRIGGADIVAINGDVFNGKAVEKVYFGANITTIGANAFKDSKLSGALELPTNLETIGADAFSGCKLTSVVIPASVTSIGKGAFFMNDKLSSVTFAEGNAITAIGEDVFLGCESLASIVLPSSVTSIEKGAFTGAGLTSIDLGDKVTTIGEHAFAGCDKLTAVTGTAALTAVARWAFASAALTEISLPAVAIIGEGAFRNNKNLATVTLGATLSTLERQVFENCSSLISVTFDTAIKDDVTTGITEIKDTAFENCYNLLNIVLPETLTTITALAFDGALKIQSIEVASENTAFATVDGVLFSKDMTTLIAYPAGKVAAEYIIAEGVTTIKASAFKNAIIANMIVALTVDTLEADAFNSMSISVIDFLGNVPTIATNPISAKLWQLYVPAANLEGFTAVAHFASAMAKPETYLSNSFYDEESGLTYIIIGENATVISADRQRTSITVPASLGGKTVNKIEAYAFANCNNLTFIRIDANLFLLGEYAFVGCTALTEISFAAIQRPEAAKDGVGSVINLNAFYDTPWYTSKNLIVVSDTAFEYRNRFDEEGKIIEVTSLTIPEGVEVLDTDLFNNAAGASLESIILPSTLEIIRAGAFKNTNISTIKIPNSVNTIATGAFENAAKLTTITLNNSAITAIAANTFKGCIALEEIILPASVKKIEAEAFFGCVALEKVTLSNSLSSIGTSAFQNCSTLPVLELPARVGIGLEVGALALGNFAFAGCDALVYIRVLNPNPALIGTDVFGANAYIYVESSDGTIITNYKTQWSVYSGQIRDQKNSPVISFIANEDSARVVIPAMKALKIASRTTAVIYYDDMSEMMRNAYPDYVFVCWTYESAPDVWTPVEYPFRTGESTTLRAKWVRTEEGSLDINDLEFSAELGGYVLNAYTGSEPIIIIPSVFGDYPLVKIGDFAFTNNHNITEIRFVPDLNGRYNLKYIGEEAFAGIDGLTRVILPPSVLEIGDRAFANCINLEYILIPQDVRSIGAEAFDGCTQLELIYFEEGSQLRFAEINSFEDTLWYTKQKEENLNFVLAGRLIIEYVKQENQNLVTLPIEAMALRAELFANDTDLITVEFHSLIEVIGDRAFFNCSSLINLDFANSDADPSQIREVGVDAFTGTAWLAQQDEFVLAGTVLIKYEGKKDPEQDEFIVQLPNFITIIDKNAFRYSALDKIVFGAQSKLQRIEDGAFSSCYNLKEINIPRLVTYIGDNAFFENTSLKSVVFSGNAVKEIGANAFFGCTALGTDIAVPQLVLPSALSVLGESAFEGCSALTNINLQNTVLTEIKSRTFFGDNNLSTVLLPDTLITLGASAFGGCTVLETITTGGNSALKEIGAGALNDTAWYIREVPEGDEDILIYIGNVLLDYRQKIGSDEKPNVVVPAQIKYIAAHAFENSRIASISLSEGLLEIGDYAFAGCTYLNIVTIPSSVTDIGVYSFSNCQNLETAELGSGLETLAESAFDNSRILTKVTVAKMGYSELTEEQNISVAIAIEEDTIDQWLTENPGVFIGTELINTNAFNDTSTYLRIYVIRDTRDINIELYRYFWGETRASQIFNTGDVPTVSFIPVLGASPIAPISTEWLTEQQAYTVFKDNTLLGWESVNSEDDQNGVAVTLPMKVIKNTTLRPIWLSNNRPANDTFLGMTYTPNADASEVIISSYNSVRDTLVIGSTVTVAGKDVPIAGVNSGVFTAANTANIKTVIFTDGGGFKMSANIFKVFANLEKFVVLGKNTSFTAIDGVLYSTDGSTVASYPRARKAEGEFAKSYVIRSGATNVLAYAFSATKLENLTIPESIKTVGEGAFEKNFSLIEGDPTHFNGLKNIVIDAANNLEYVAYGAFDETAWFKEMTGAFKLAGSYLLSYNGYTDKVTIPSTVKTIGVMAFQNNDLNNITQLTIPASVRKINEDAFINCNALATILFDAGSLLMDIANDVFNDTSWIDAMNLETSEFIVAGNVLISYKGGRDYLPLPNEIKVIGYNAFNNAQFTEITLHNSLLRIDENAFYGCDNLTSISIPASVTSIGKGAFYGCLDLNTFTFAQGSTLKTIGDSAFAYSSKLSSITIPDSVEVIGNSAFEQCISLKNATFSTTSALINLGASAFKKATGLETVFIPDGLKEIKTSTFEACQGLKTVNFSSNNRKLTTIGENAFKGCTVLGNTITNSLLTVQLPANVTRILPGAFADCISLYGIQMQGQIVSIGLNAFSGCSKLANVTISTARPPIIDAGSFNYSAHSRLRVYVNNSVGQQVLNDYVVAWGGEKVSKSGNIFVRGEQSFPLIQFYNINRAGEEVHLTGNDMHAEFLTAAKLPSLQDDEGRGMSTGFFRSSTFESATQVAAGASITVIQDETPLKLYVKWTN